MITNFNTSPNILPVYYEALRYKSFGYIKDTFLSGLDGNTTFDDTQKLAIKLAAEKLPEYPNSDIMTIDGPLLGILNLDWESVGADGVTALTSEQRANIFAGVMTICKGIVTTEAARLTAVAALDTSLPDGWDAAD